MKKFLAMAFCAMMMVSCGGGGVKADLISAIEDATEEMENAKNAEDVQAISDNFQKKMKELEEKYGEEAEKMSEADQKEVQDALGKFISVSMTKGMELNK